MIHRSLKASKRTKQRGDQLSREERLKIRLGIGVFTTADLLIRSLRHSFSGRKGVRWCEYFVDRSGKRMTAKGCRK